MRITLTNPITGKASTTTARFSIDHPASRYHQTVLVDKNGVIDHTNWVLQGGQIVSASDREREQFAKWHHLIEIAIQP